MLLTLTHAFDRRMGLTPEERREYRLLFGDPWVLVQTLLGHPARRPLASIYLEPVSGLQVELFLNDDGVTRKTGVLHDRDRAPGPHGTGQPRETRDEPSRGRCPNGGTDAIRAGADGLAVTVVDGTGRATRTVRLRRPPCPWHHAG
jgi:hypothetical protein